MKLRVVSLFCALVLSVSLLAGCGSAGSSDSGAEPQSAPVCPCHRGHAGT
ncbi:hypothetical protein [uncultured Gemmiger sp.]|nr:hypothetical protein [uncultured Gemmiger sp.]